jgi:hypothetical protein
MALGMSPAPVGREYRIASPHENVPQYVVWTGSPHHKVEAAA